MKIMSIILDYYNTSEKGANTQCTIAESTGGKKSIVGMKVK